MRREQVQQRLIEALRRNHRVRRRLNHAIDNRQVNRGRQMGQVLKWHVLLGLHSGLTADRGTQGTEFGLRLSVGPLVRPSQARTGRRAVPPGRLWETPPAIRM